MTESADRCTFCDLIHGSANGSICYEDAEAVAFMDDRPVNAGQVLVVPRAHYASFMDVPGETGSHLFGVTARLAAAIHRVTRCDDINIVASAEGGAHYCLHIIPRRADDGFRLDLPFASSRVPDRASLDVTAVQIVVAMRDTLPEAPSADPVTVEIPASEIAAMNAETGEAPVVAGRAAPRVPKRIDRPEREVVVQVAREGVSSGDPSHRGSWHLQEGAHGELVYDNREPL